MAHIAAKEHRRRLAQRYLITLRRAEQINFRLWTASVGGLFHFKPSVQCLLVADFVAKVGGPLQERNFRIQWARRLNQYCAAGLFFESILRVGMRKIFLQQYRHIASFRTYALNGRYRRQSGHRSTLALTGSVANDRAARLAAIPAGESPANRGVQSLL